MVRTCHRPRQPLQTVLQGTLVVWQRRGRRMKCWMDNVKEWTSLPVPDLLTVTSCTKDWKRICAESSFVAPRRPNRSRDWTELNWTVEECQNASFVLRWPCVVAGTLKIQQLNSWLSFPLSLGTAAERKHSGGVTFILQQTHKARVQTPEPKRTQTVLTTLHDSVFVHPKPLGAATWCKLEHLQS